MNQDLKEKPPFWFPIAPIMVIVFIYLVLLLSRQILIWLDLETYLGIPIIIRYIFGVPLIMIGLVFFIGGFARLKPAAAIGFAKRLRDTGAYGLTCNPMYFGLNATFWGTGLLLDNLSVLIGAFIWSILNYLSVTLWEEKQMYSKFGEEYLEYKKRVPRFIPIRLTKS
ncbi:MAG: isoprenylcysteine carboxylmethyltransferase family protein [Ignavibacteria bacterium]|nr:isoprenylcysteine carboxylmethyltransferase family protein [Ignavibacteria bacterium]